MDWQLTATLALVVFASCYLAWRGWRTWSRKRGNCGGGCACSSATPAPGPEAKLTSISLEKLAARAKK